MGDADVQRALRKLVDILDEERIPYTPSRARWRSTSTAIVASGHAETVRDTRGRA